MAAHHKLGTASEKQLVTCKESLQDVVRLALTFCKIDFSVVEGRRTRAKQKENNEASPRVSWTMDSDHLAKDEDDEDEQVNAVDIYPWVGGKTSDLSYHYRLIARAMFEAAGVLNVQLHWGGFWRDKRLDQPHWALSRKYK